MTDPVFRGISKKSYNKAVFLHLSFFLFIVIPLSLFVPEYLDGRKATPAKSAKLITISEDDYRKIANNTKVSTITTPSPNVANNKQTATVLKIAPKPIKKTGSTKKKNIVHNNVAKKVDAQKVPIESAPEETKNNIMDSSLTNTQQTDFVTDDLKTTVFGDFGDVIAEETTVSVQDIIAVQLNKCWDEYYSSNTDTKGMVVTALIGYSKNGSVNKISIENKFLLSKARQVVYQAMIESAKRSIAHCSPLKGLPISMYDEWRYVRINFRHGSVTK